jgi:hypothetical protein
VHRKSTLGFFIVAPIQAESLCPNYILVMLTGCKQQVIVD